MPKNLQLSLFTAIQDTYREAANDAPISNAYLYGSLIERGVVTHDEIHERVPVGRAGALHSVGARKVRWLQNTMRSMGVLERVDGMRGRWRISPDAKKRLTQVPEGVTMLAFESKFGFAIWSDCRTFFSGINEEIHAVISSPPYPLRQKRAYGNPTEQEYVDFILRCIDPILKNLVDGGSIVLNLSNDIFEAGLPSRSMYLERLMLALHDQGLRKMDSIVWHNASKPPGPMQWSSRTRQQLNVAWEPCYWLTNNPAKVRSDNRRILKPHTDRQKTLIAAGGEDRTGVWSDGAYRIKPGSFGGQTEGSIERNLWSIGHRCARHNLVRRYQAEQGLPAHGAPMPYALADRFVRFLTEPGELVVDPFAGTLTTGDAAEQNERRWICTDTTLEYLMGGRVRFPGLVAP
ncbi:site-specific DNA-methyltransferase [Hydrogenophaga sp. 2FB]|uniref:DNA-methyltransferase n=1 Tax=Hydrogenophaga sp. 2FB TaxID=2502187 RepID=UPI0010F7C4A7|nr:site-specific DNA-methyltransferase [Hydrogenophaga sp. 2FB]